MYRELVPSGRALKPIDTSNVTVVAGLSRPGSVASIGAVGPGNGRPTHRHVHVERLEKLHREPESADRGGT